MLTIASTRLIFFYLKQAIKKIKNSEQFEIEQTRKPSNTCYEYIL